MGGGNIYSIWVFVVQSFLADQFIHLRELRVVSLESSSSVDYAIKKISLTWFKFSIALKRLFYAIFCLTDFSSDPFDFAS